MTGLASLESIADAAEPVAGPCHMIPCCYEFGLDFGLIEKHTGLDRDVIIRLHSGTIYTVYAIGFCPGFPYLGYLPAELPACRAWNRRGCASNRAASA